MTATLVALLIEEGRLRWDMPLLELFPELAQGIHPAYRDATVEMLLRHEAGLPDDRYDLAHSRRMASLRGSPSHQRREAARLALARPPAYKPGTRNVYANMSYDILGAAVERWTGESWEAQLAKRIYGPLGMVGAGFGSPSAPGEVDQPWGHAVRGSWPKRLFWIERTLLPPAAAPAGNASMSLGDWARFAALHLEAMRGRCRLLSCASFERLHHERVKGSGFACGWGVSKEKTGIVLGHAGSDGWWYALAVLDAARGEAFLAAANAGGERGAAACQEAVAVMRSRNGTRGRNGE
jgi:CubicO group peptidase (beta-lactamase class C family)